MFTGLIETVGSVVALRRAAAGAVLELAAELPADAIAIGDSIAVNGACLTVTAKGGGRFCFDVSPETVERTAMRNLQPGSRVNLERAMQLGHRLDGHLVTGHVDCTARLENKSRRGNAVLLTFSLPVEHARMLVAKGSVAVDGISLTVNRVEDQSFDVSIIPLTLAKTTLASLERGGEVNIETDIIGKYVVRLLGPHRQERGLTMESLLRNGFA